jgi:predicted nucleic-acid-binding Zn-ribbon protein
MALLAVSRESLRETEGRARQKLFRPAATASHVVPDDDSGATGDDGDGRRRPYVYCAECGAKASPDWSFCRSCEASLEDAETADGKVIVRNDGEDVDLTEFVGEETGCRKCGHEDVTVEDVAATGDGAARLLDVENRRFRAVACARCGYTEFYSGRSSREAVDLFVR